MRSLTLATLVALLSIPVFAAPELRLVASGLQLPVAVAHAGDSRLFITQQRGTIAIFDGVSVLPTPFLDIRPLVFCGTGGGCGERGLLSTAFHPRYRENGFFFVYYTDLTGDLVVARYRVSNDPYRADPASGSIILKIAHRRFPNHNGGQLQFGRDGYLYIGTGDGGSGGDPDNNGQTLTSLLGKMLRIDVDSSQPSAIPASNPFVGRTDARAEVWAYGLRNPWRFSFDRENGDLWIADVGQGEWEEVNLQPSTSIGGENYGWKRLEGTHCYPPPSSNCQSAGTVFPVIEYDHSNRACSVTGGYRYRGARNPSIRGAYIYGDFCNGVIWAANLEFDGRWISRTLLSTGFQLSTFGEDFNGELYVANYSGSLYKLVDPAFVAARRRAVRR